MKIWLGIFSGCVGVSIAVSLIDQWRFGVGAVVPIEQSAFWPVLLVTAILACVFLPDEGCR